MEGVIKSSASDDFILSAEINPTQTGIETRSKDWGDTELARLWIIDRQSSGELNVHPVGQARIFAAEQPPSQLN